MPRNAGGAEPQRGNKQVIAFGLVNVPVKVKPLRDSRSKTNVSANYICPDHQGPLKTHRYCESGDHYPDAVKAYPVDGGYVEIDEDTLAAIAAERTGELRIERFVPLEQIDPIYFTTPYLVYPGEGGASQYDLIAAAMRKAKQAAVGNSVLPGGKSTSMIVVRWSETTETLIAHACAYAEALRWSDVDLVANALKARPDPAKAQLDLAAQVIASLEGDFDPAAVEDTYTGALRDLVQQVASGKALPTPTAPAKPVTNADDLMAQLRESVATAKKAPKKAKAGVR